MQICDQKNCFRLLSGKVIDLGLFEFTNVSQCVGQIPHFAGACETITANQKCPFLDLA